MVSVVQNKHDDAFFILTKKVDGADKVVVVKIMKRTLRAITTQSIPIDSFMSKIGVVPSFKTSITIYDCGCKKLEKVLYC